MSRPTNPETPLVAGAIDSHCHFLDMARKGVDVRGMLSRWVESGGAWTVDVGVDLEGVQVRRTLAAGFPQVLRTHGLYPSVAAEPDVASLVARLESLCRTDNPVAIGEIGLDYHRDYASPVRQQDLFRRQIALAHKLSRPVVVHNRAADLDLLSALRDSTLERCGVMHCFSGDLSFARKCIDAGFYLSFAGNVTFKNADSLRDVARYVPDDRLLVETDAPYLAPHPLRGRTNHPGLIGHTYACVADARGISADGLAQLVLSNFTRLFRPEEYYEL
ncbi:MAG TPA: TatD family hydrolase [Spirochaetia bacterium]|nr:TatD family hydrolase [Spirochaetia bacterium]